MALLNALESNTIFFLFTVIVLSLSIGSFLNVVIYRLPIMLKSSWREQCTEYMASEAPADQSNLDSHQKPEKFNLATPRSRCPSCGHQITALENIPVVSYIFLKGRCSKCKSPISIRYPVVEIATAVLSAVVAIHYGFGWQCLTALLLTWSLIVLTMIDFDHKLLPDDITLSFLWTGILLSMFGWFTDTNSSIIGAIAGYLALWSVYWAFKLLTGKEGMGYGDFKLLAMLGAWMGWQALPGIVLLSSFVGAVVGVSLIAFKGRDKNIPIPFGPYLATAGWIYLLWGHNISSWYFSISGIK